MNGHISRRFALASAAAGASLVVCRSAAAAQPDSVARAATDSTTPPWPGFPLQDPALVREMVGVCHRDLDRVRALLTDHPALANAAVDWGFGDWETALGAAAHTGRREIAETLLACGARPDIFAAAMLGGGWLDVVKATVAARPEIVNLPGPHGIPLIEHARAGGDQALEVVRYLESVSPGGDGAQADVPGEAELAACAGDYRAEPGGEVFSIIRPKRGGLAFKARTGSERPLRPGPKTAGGGRSFHPAGTSAVKIEFAPPTGAPSEVRAVTITDGPRVVTARRLIK